MKDLKKILLALLMVLSIMTSAAMAVTGDVVFVIDDSGSMQPAIDGVKNNVNNIFGTLQAQGDFAVGVVAFGSYLNNGAPRVFTQLTKDPATFSTALTKFTAGGGTQPGFDAVVTATDKNKMGLRGVSTCTIMITDEEADRVTATKQDAINALNAVPSAFIVVYKPSYYSGGNTAKNDYGIPNGLAGSANAGGAEFLLSDFLANPGPVTTAILNKCAAEIGRIQLEPQTATNPVGSTHTVTATVKDGQGNPAVGVTVTFTVLSGPNAGQTGTEVTDAAGKASWTYPDNGGAGTDTIQASFLDGQQTRVSNKVEKIWGGPNSVPEFPTLIVPIVGILGIMHLLNRRKEN